MIQNLSHFKEVDSEYNTVLLGLVRIFLKCMDIWGWASLVAQMVQNLPAIQGTWVQSLGWEDLLEKGKATYWGPAPAGSRDIQSMMVSATERLIER